MHFIIRLLYKETCTSLHLDFPITRLILFFLNFPYLYYLSCVNCVSCILQQGVDKTGTVVLNYRYFLWGLLFIGTQCM